MPVEHGDRWKLTQIAKGGPLLRGSEEWEDRELARRVLGAGCLSYGTVAEARARETKREKNVVQHMNLTSKRK